MGESLPTAGISSVIGRLRAHFLQPTFDGACVSVKSTTERVRALRKRRREAGLVRVEAWVRPQHVDGVKSFLARLEKRVLPSRSFTR